MENDEIHVLKHDVIKNSSLARRIKTSPGTMDSQKHGKRIWVLYAPAHKRRRLFFGNPKKLLSTLMCGRFCFDAYFLATLKKAIEGKIKFIESVSKF